MKIAIYIGSEVYGEICYDAELLHSDISKISEITELAKDLKKTLHLIFAQA